jgi:hypothetical protein
MADAYKCDRCGEFYIHHKKLDNAVTVLGREGCYHPILKCYQERDKEFQLDLCPRCMGEFAGFMNAYYNITETTTAKENPEVVDTEEMNW